MTMKRKPSRAHCVIWNRYRTTSRLGFLTDYKAAREIALANRIRVSGSVGCLILVVDRQLLSADEANGLLQDMIQQGYRSSVADLDGFV